MIAKFKSYLLEQPEISRMGIQDLEALINSYLSSKEVVSTEYDNIKRRLNRVIETEFEKLVARPHYWGNGQQNSEMADQALKTIIFDKHIYTTREVIAVSKLLPKVKDTSNPIYKSVKSFVDSYKEASENFTKLKDYVVKASVKKAQAQAAVAQANQKMFMDSSSLVKVLETHMAEFIKRAETFGEKVYQTRMDAILKAGGLDEIAPRPTIRMSREEYRAAQSKRQMYESVLKSSKQDFSNLYGRAAKEDYMAWIYKMTQKIGTKVIDAIMTGSPWTGSIITVTLESGQTEVWNTKMIINNSKFGKPFNQFPTTKKK